MKRRQSSIPRQWLIVDARLGDRLWIALKRVPRSSGMLILLHELPASERERMIRRLRRRAAAKSLLVVDEAKSAVRAHNLSELRRELLARTPLILLSPLYPTRTHPERTAIPRMRAAIYARLAGRRLIALGGMNERRFRRIERLGFVGWAGIDAWLRT